jgi:hypothetical protein
MQMRKGNRGAGTPVSDPDFCYYYYYYSRASHVGIRIVCPRAVYIQGAWDTLTPSACIPHLAQ